MLDNLAEIILKSKIEKDNAVRTKRFLPWSSIEKIALIINSEQQINKSVLDKYIERSKKHVEVFYIELTSKVATYSDWECFTKKDKSLFRLPKQKRLSALKNSHFDLVINTSLADELYSTSISSALKAELKCGLSERFRNTDLIIKHKEPFDLIKYLDDVVTYLKMIKH